MRVVHILSKSVSSFTECFGLLRACAFHKSSALLYQVARKVYFRP